MRRTSQVAPEIQQPPPPNNGSAVNGSPTKPLSSVEGNNPARPPVNGQGAQQADRLAEKVRELTAKLEESEKENRELLHRVVEMNSKVHITSRGQSNEKAAQTKK